MSALEDKFHYAVVVCRLPKPEREYQFHTGRRWRFDFAWPARMVAVEIEGGVWNGGRHTRGAGYAADLDKYNQAVMDGWRVLRFSGEHLKDMQSVIDMVKEALR